MRTPWSLVAISSLLLIGLAVRVAVLGVDGHNGDVSVMARWAGHMVEFGPWQFYEHDGSIYPALLYPLWALASVLDGEQLDLAIKALSIPFDLVLGAVLFAFLARRGAPAAGLAAAALYLLNPAVILAGPVWGQVDSAGTLAYLGAILASGARRNGLAGGLGILAVFFKPQFGLVLLPVLIVAAVRSYRSREAGPLAWALSGVAATWLIVGGPLALHPLRYAELFSATAGQQPFTSLHAFNPWGLLTGFEMPDDRFVLIGAVLLVLAITETLLTLRRGQDIANVLAVGALLVLAFYFLPTRVHERYLFPAMALLAPFAPAGRGALAAYVVLSGAFAVSLLYVLHDITPFNLPEAIAEVVVTPAGVWGIGLTMIAGAIGWVCLLRLRRPRLPGVDPDPAS